MEIWKIISDYPKYEISDQGKVRNAKRKNIIVPEKNNRGYYQVTLYNDYGRKQKYIHRLVANEFCENNNSETEINHIDGNKTNNSVYNLEFCSRSKNMSHAYRTGLKKPSGQFLPRKVRILETGETFDSLSDCARHIGGRQDCIALCINGNAKTHLKYHFEEIFE